jgi:hypothetical protein
VELSRGLAFGTIGSEPLLALVHVAVLAVIFGLGVAWANRTVERRLVRG